MVIHIKNIADKKLTYRILNMDVDVTSYEDATALIHKWQFEKAGRYVCVANVHMCMEAYDDSDFKKVVNSADLVVPDGKPLVWALRALGVKNASQVRGSDLLLKLCKKAENHSIPVGLYGGTQNSLNNFIAFIKKEFPDLSIPFFSAPPFRELIEEEDLNYMNEINASGVRILFVGIGCPKQEKWMVAHKDKLSCVIVGVGAAFDFFSGQKKHAPRWMQKAGLEWLFRFACDPQRLWKRYLKHNPRFVYFFLRQWLRERE